jgi:hypothetical protein
MFFCFSTCVLHFVSLLFHSPEEMQAENEAQPQSIAS